MPAWHGPGAHPWSPSPSRPSRARPAGPAGVGFGVGFGDARGFRGRGGRRLGARTCRRGRRRITAGGQRLVLSPEDRERDEADEDEGDRTRRPEANEHSRRKATAVGRLDTGLARQRWSGLGRRPPRRHVERIERGLRLIRLRSWRRWLFGDLGWRRSIRIRVRRVARVGPLGGSFSPLLRSSRAYRRGLRQLCGPSGTRVNWPYDAQRPTLSRVGEFTAAERRERWSRGTSGGLRPIPTIEPCVPEPLPAAAFATIAIFVFVTPVARRSDLSRSVRRGGHPQRHPRRVKRGGHR